MTSKKLHVRLNHQQVQNMYSVAAQPGKKSSKQRDNLDTGSSSSEQYATVEYSFQDTFTSLLEKCLIALRISLNESSSTNFSNDEQNSFSRGSVTKQALLYDADHNLVTMLQEAHANQYYSVEIIDSRLIELNQLVRTQSPQLANDAGGDLGSGSFNNYGNQGPSSHKSSLAYQSRDGSFAGGRYESFASVSVAGDARGSRLRSVDSDDLYMNTKNDIGSSFQAAQRKTKFRVALVGSAGAGKTSMAYRFVDRSCYLDEYEPTIVDTFEQDMNMIDPSDGLNRVVNLTIVDIGSHVLKEQMLLDCDAVLFCYDVTSQESFYALSGLFQMKIQLEYNAMENAATSNDSDEEQQDLSAAMATLQHSIAKAEKPQQRAYLGNKPTHRHKPVILVGCKNERTDDRQIEYVDGERCAESFKAPYIECSAATNHRVEDVFELTLIQLFKKERYEREELQEALQQKRMMQEGQEEASQRRNRMRGQDQACCTIF